MGRKRKRRTTTNNKKKKNVRNKEFDIDVAVIVSIIFRNIIFWNNIF